ncbi:ABC transporter permease [Mucilaginibacter endophyticus]|uniref:ABC transporter permease n=1 Tax=Mucilaginibacter endophyticus TaxID=2675003 RepID=UPI0012B16DF7|nr:ABC transporter permease [Mucilaginibacter endophyticus]
MDTTIFNIAPYQLVRLTLLVSGITLALLLWFTRKNNPKANWLLSLALIVSLSHVAGLPPAVLLAFGPLLYLYVRQLVLGEGAWRWQDGLHFCPLLVGYWIPGGLVLIPVIVYLYLSHRLIRQFYQSLQPVLMDRPRFAFRGLEKVLILLGLLCLPGIINGVFCLAIAPVMMGMAVAVILKTDVNVQLTTGNMNDREKARRLKEAVAAGRLYEDAELTLTSLAIKLGLHPHELSRIINNGLQKNFNDLINGFRVREVARKMRDPAYDRFTLLGIAYESGFNSQRTFTRVFKELTGKSPVEYKNSLKKEWPNDKLAIPSSLRPVILRQESPAVEVFVTTKRNIMIRNYFKIAYRSLSRNIGMSIINISSLAIGLACVLLIGLYIGDELGYDRFFKNAERIYRVNIHEKDGNNEFTAAHTPPPVGAALQAGFPEIESYTRIYQPGDQVVHFDRNGRHEALIDKKCLSVDSNFLQFFSYPLLKGNAASCLNGPGAVVLTESGAKRYFGNADPIGKSMVIDGYDTPFTVTAVLKDLPARSSMQFDMLQCNLGMPAIKRYSWSWVWLQTGTFVKLRPNVPNTAADVQKLVSRFPEMVRVQAATAFRRIGTPFDEYLKKGNKYEVLLQPLTDMHFYSAQIGNRYFIQGDIKYVYIFSAIALFIILLACFNFMNLATAQSAKRAREVGIRKVLGSERRQLIWQFLSEALVYTLLAGIVAITLVICVLPAFNRLASKSIPLIALFDARVWGGMLLLTLLTALFAGSYPAFFLTAFKPVAVLKGNTDGKTSKAGFSTRNVLVIFQFAVSAVMIICTIVVYKQLRYNQSKDLGYNKENILVIGDAEWLGNKEENFRQEILKLPGVGGATMSTNLPASQKYFEDEYKPEMDASNPSSAEKTLDLSSYMVDEAFVPTFKLRLIAGRNFSKAYNDSASVILNEAAAKIAGWKNPIGQHISYHGGGDKRFEVIGITQDFNPLSLHDQIMPWALFYTKSGNYLTHSSYIAVKLRPGDYAGAINRIRSVWKSFMPEYPFDYHFLDQQYDELYRTDQTMGKVFSVFTVLSVIVACLGLFGLAMYTAERRTKEIGIRKVLGASIANVVMMLSRDFLKLVLLASVIAFPVAWYAMHTWLQDFAYRTSISWWVFVFATGIVTLIALVTISFQALKAATNNPVKSLKSE